MLFAVIPSDVSAPYLIFRHFGTYKPSLSAIRTHAALISGSFDSLDICMQVAAWLRNSFASSTGTSPNKLFSFIWKIHLSLNDSFRIPPMQSCIKVTFYVGLNRFERWGPWDPLIRGRRDGFN